MRADTLAEVLGVPAGALSGLVPLASVENRRPNVFSFFAGEQRYVVKCCRNDNVVASESLDWEARVLKILEISGSTPSPVIPVVDEMHHGFLVPYIESNATIKPGDDAIITAVATCLGRLHAVDWRIPYLPSGLNLPVLFGGHFFWIGGNEIVRRRIECISNAAIKDAALHAVEMLERSRQMLVEPFAAQTMSIIHGDVTFENMAFLESRDGVAVKLIDFGEAAIGPPQLDLARYAIIQALSSRQECLLLDSYCATVALDGCSIEMDVFCRGFERAKVLALFDLLISGPVMRGPNWEENSVPGFLSNLKRLSFSIDRL